MSEEAALLAAIAADPADDTVRLAYADFVEESGDPDRAEFIRNQIELSRIDGNDPTRRARVLRNVRFLQECVPRWKAAMPELPGIVWGDFDRGLVEEVQASSATPIVRHAEAIFAEPAIHVIRLSRLSDARDLAKLAQLLRVRILRMVGARAEFDILRDLFASKYLGNLMILDLHGNRLGDQGAAMLANTELPAITELWLGVNGIGVAGASALVKSPRFQNLQFLDLRGNLIRDAGVRGALVRRFGSRVKL